MKSHISNITLFVYTLAVAAPAFQLPANYKAFAENAVRGILECKFDDVIALTDSVYTHDNENPLAAVMRLAALGMRDVDLDSTIDAAAFASSFERAKNAVDRYESINGVDSYALTLRGFALAMNAAFHLKKGSGITASSAGLSAIRAMKEARELDPQNAEVNFFLGMYDYAKSELKKRLPWVTFWFPGNRLGGIRQLEEGAQNAVITKTACALALSDVYLKERQPRRSRDIVYALKRDMPQSRFVLWAEAKYYENRRMFSQAADAYGNLADRYDAHPYGAYNAAVTRNKQAHMQSGAGEADMAVGTCRSIIERYGGGNDRRINEIIRNTERLLRRLER